jgi:hypothetical protein
MMGADTAFRSRTDVQVAVAALVRREATDIRTWALNARPGEEYDNEFYSTEVLPTAVALLDNVTPQSEPILVAALVESVYGTGSRMAERLASLGEAAMPAISKLSRSAAASQRSNAYDLLGMMLAKQSTGGLRRPLTSSSVLEARRVLTRGLRDLNVVARRDAVRAITKARYRGAIAALRELAARDPDVGQEGFEWNSVRALAAAALRQLN